MVDGVIYQNFAVALALGTLIGLEREYARYRSRGHTYAGIRTFPLIALFGAISAYLGELISPWILLIATILSGGLILIAYFTLSKQSRKFIGATTEMAGLLTFFIGVLCYYGQITFSVILTVVIASILYLRSVLHHFTEKIKQQEMADTLKFVVVAFVILPLLPNKAYGPWGGIFNPYLIWLLIVFVSAISFVGYILMKWLGERGIALSGLLGGLVSSTAVTSSFAERSKKEKKIYSALVLGVILANGVMFFRFLVEVLVLNRELLVQLLLPMLILAMITAIFAYFLWKKAKEVKGKIELTSPFTLTPALKFGLLFAIVLVLTKVAEVYLSSKGVYLVSFLSGFAEVDAIVVSLSQLAGPSLALETARNGIILAVLVNIGVKGGIAYIFGGKEFRKIIARFYAVLIGVGLAMLILL